MNDLSALDADVSRETIDRLNAYVELLKKWNPAINLVSRSTLSKVWDRHIVDSAQVFMLSTVQNGTWVDVGSGGGFPGMVCAILAKEKSPQLKFVLIESDQRKATFLRTVARDVGVDVEVISKRIEDVEPQKAQVLTARALASLNDLLGMCKRHLSEDGVALLPKGLSHQDELGRALENWKFSYHKHPSLTDSASVIFEIGEIKRV